MPYSRNRSALYGEIADRLTATCMKSVDGSGGSRPAGVHGSPSLGHVAYVLGELHRCRPALDLSSIHGCDLVAMLRHLIVHGLDLRNEIHRCFLAMGLGLFGPDNASHLILKDVPADSRRRVRDGLVVTKEFDNNWEAFNGSIMIGRHLLYGDPAETVIPHFEKIAAKYDETGYFDDTAGLGNYNNYGLMSINYPLRAVEFLEKGHPVRAVMENRFKGHALRYLELIRTMVSPEGDTWPFGRSAGVLGLLQCITLIEQCLSKNWIERDQVNRFRAIARRATRRMHDLYWDDELQWFNFRDDYQTAYDYRASLPMAWDMLRYFLQIEEYAATDEREGIPESEAPVHGGPCHREVVTNPELKTAVYVWSDGKDHAVLPIMAGPHGVTGDSLARPYAQGLFEWTTQKAVPALCPRLTIGGEHYWPTWRAAETELSESGETKIYRALFSRLCSDRGDPCHAAIACDTRYLFSPGRFERADTWIVRERTEIDEFLLEVLQPARHPKRPSFGNVYDLRVTWESGIAAVGLSGKTDVRALPEYRNYHGHASNSWKIRGDRFVLENGTYATALRLEW